MNSKFLSENKTEEVLSAYRLILKLDLKHLEKCEKILICYCSEKLKSLSAFKIYSYNGIENQI